MGHSSEHSQERIDKDNQLRLIRSPLAFVDTSNGYFMARRNSGQPDIENLGNRDGPEHDCPEFQKHEDATNVELFYDLFFAANLTVFSEVHEVSNGYELRDYIGFFCILWITWGLVGLFDVRFVTDSIFERIARSFQLGVMVGFAVVAAKFDLHSDQQAATLRTMSIILAVSRFTLAAQYSTILWHVRAYRKTILPLCLMIGINIVVGAIYLGISFRFKIDGTHTRLYTIWYILGGIELLLCLGLSLGFKVLSFVGTHLTSRMRLLTLIIIGEGIIVLCKNITVIVESSEEGSPWTSATIGVLAAAVATLYIVYMIYMDWMRHIHMHMHPVRQLTWTLLHLFFHLALTLFVEGASQFVIWYKVIELIDGVTAKFYSGGDELVAAVDAGEEDLTTAYVKYINESINAVLEQYPPVYSTDTHADINSALDDISTIPADWWTTPYNESDPIQQQLDADNTQILFSVTDSILTSFHIDGSKAVNKHFDFNNGTLLEYEQRILDEDQKRYNTVFIYAFAAAGFVLVILNLLFIASRTKKWTWFDIFRTVVNFALGIGLCLTTLISVNNNFLYQFQDTPWILPTICLTFFVVLVLNHLPHPPPWFFDSKKKGTLAKET